MVGWNVRPKQLVAQLLFKDKYFILLLSYLHVLLLCMNFV
jgi:hypothetical protein